MTLPPGAVPTIDVREVVRRLHEDAVPPLVIDVREMDEFLAVRPAEGAALVPMSSFGAKFQELPRDRPLFMLCASGNRSSAATAHLLRNGFTDVSNVAGGIIEWQRAGLPVRRGPVAPGEGDLPTG
jgi:rhodanese-related sulfurtransferase